MTSIPAPPLKPDPAKSYYVIIGCGFSGILNHVLLRRASTRLGGRDVLHIGMTDPWRDYHSMAMGQWPSLLTLPGFTKPPSALSPFDNLGSSEFADNNEFEWNRLLATNPFYHAVSRVVAIKASKIGPPYKVELDDGSIFQAEYIDVCGGPGPARTPSMNVDSTLLSEFSGSAPGPFGWPRLVSGEDFLTSTTPAVPAGRRICVYGGGPTGAWCVERAQQLGHQVYWVAKEELNTAFVASRRNDGLLQGTVVRKIIRGNHVVTGRLRPASSSTFFGENLAATTIAETASGEVVTVFAPATPAARFTDNSGPMPVPSALEADQVVLSIGQETRYKDPHSWASLLRPVLRPAIRTRTHLITDNQGRVVGLHSHDDRIRVLGAAALSHPKVAVEWRRSGSKSNLFFRSLIEQARVPIGITVSAISVAEANDFWSGARNDNLNTCGLEDLRHLIASWPAELHGAETWFEMRGHRIPPFDRFEFADFAKGGFSY
ncbi:hypothetical protein MYCO108962_17645 [Mycobacterium colombiense]|uniref:hypothetical protein n=1 Tax=Mycobacterium colombiense TaxID=339268 RepID=UPI0011E4CA38|nr:hypothetical protein [Mycobacterium colombiense]